jgi:hypothetical protein
LTPAAIARQATTVANDSWLQSIAAGHCIRETGRLSEADILPA